LNYSWPNARFPDMPEQEKKYDFVNFAFSMDLRKGDEDSIRALAIVKKTYPNVTLNIAGGFSPDRKRYLEGVIDALGLKENVSFTPFFEKHEDMIKHIMQSRFAVLPIKLDLVSTTVKEAMFYKLAVVTNSTKGTPNLNREKQCVLLAEIDNIDSLADKMLELMQDSGLAELLVANSYDYQLRQQEKNAKKIDRFINILKAVYHNKYDQMPIPQELLLN
jgi:glycosyltransferase involved in cell wall biosynthesis